MQANSKAHAFLLPIMFSTEQDELSAFSYRSKEKLSYREGWMVIGNLFHSIGPLNAKLRFPWSLVLILGTSSWPWADEGRDALPGTVECQKSERYPGAVPGVNETQEDKSCK